MPKPIIITRYGIMNKDPKWYKSRIPYVENYIESLRRQTFKDFQVLLLVDDSIPAESLTDLNKLAFDDRMDISKRGVKEPFNEPTLQIRIDSDDYVSCDFVELIVKNAKLGYVTYLKRGYFERNGLFYERTYPFNMFLSLYAKESVYSHGHTLMHKAYPHIAVDSDPAWVHVIQPSATTYAKNENKDFGSPVKPNLEKFSLLKGFDHSIKREGVALNYNQMVRDGFPF